MASLTGQTIASTYDALLKISDNGPINGTLKQITDGLGNNTPLYLSGNTVSIDGSFKLTGRLFDKNNESGVAGQFLVSSGDGIDWQNISESGLITGAGTASFLSKFTAGGVIANSIVSESASGIGIGITATQKLHVLGNGLFTGTLNSSNLSGSSSGTNTGDETNATIKTKLGQVSPSNDGYLNSVDYESFLNKVPQTRTITINGETFDLSANRTYSVNVGVTSFNTRVGAVSLSSLDVTNALGYTPAIDSRIMTINGVGYSLAADRTWNVGTVTSVGTSAPLTGGTITGSGTIGINQSNTTTDGYLSATDWNTFNNKQANLGYTPENLANKGINNGYASLGGDGKVPSTQLPSYVDDVVEVANFAALPATGETGKIYVTLDNDFVYRWSGSIYVRISSPNAIWGSITGTLSNQIDLQNALNAKVSSVGLDLGTSGTDVNVANSPITSSGNITLNLPTASATNRGLLSSANWTTFNNKQNALTLTTTGTSGASTLVGSTLNIPQYQPQLSGTGFVKISGTTISYDNSSYALASAISGTTNYLPKFTGANTIGNSNLQTDTSGNLGLGVTPSGKLDVFSASDVYANIYTSGNGTSSVLSMYNSSGVTDGAAIGYNNALRFGTITGLNAAGFSLKMTLGANGILSLPSSGSLEIGYTSSPSLYKLDVNGTGRFAGKVTFDNILRYIEPAASGDYFRIAQNSFATGIQIGFDNSVTFTPALTIASTGAATFSSSVTSNGQYYKNAVIAGSSGSPSYESAYSYGYGSNDFGSLQFFNEYASTLATGFRLKLTNASNTVIYPLTIASTGAATFSSSVATTGVIFPATQVASADPNTLDDYEEGTWTPVLLGGTTNPTVTYATGNTGGIYTKVGNIVTITFEVRWTSLSGGSGTVIISGLPFVRRNSNLPDGERLILDSYNNVINGLYIIGNVGGNSTNISLSLVRSNNTTIDLLISDLSTSVVGFLRGTVTYFV